LAAVQAFATRLAASQVRDHHRITVIVIRQSWPGQSARAYSRDIFPLLAGAEMIVTRLPAARSSVATRP
jgi:hypothetical protein